jgi:hypothetical protein
VPDSAGDGGVYDAEGQAGGGNEPVKKPGFEEEAGLAKLVDEPVEKTRLRGRSRVGRGHPVLAELVDEPVRKNPASRKKPGWKKFSGNSP